MVKEKRFDIILKGLEKKGEVSFEELATRLRVSEDTIRRDIEYLHKNGLVSKVRGGAILRSKNPLTFQDRQQYLKKEKDIIALKVQPLIRDGMTVFMDGGTTICAVAAYFPVDIKLRVVTNNHILIDILAAYNNVDLILTGGNYDRNLQTFSGHAACAVVGDYTADLYLMGTCGVDMQFGVSATFKEDAEVKRAMKRNACKTIVLANHERIGSVDAFKVCTMQDVDVLITDLNSNDKNLNEYRDSNIRIL